MTNDIEFLNRIVENEDFDPSADELDRLIALARLGANMKRERTETTMTDELTRLKAASQIAIQAHSDLGERLSYAERGGYQKLATPELILSLIARLERAEEALKPWGELSKRQQFEIGCLVHSGPDDYKKIRAIIKTKPASDAG